MKIIAASILFAVLAIPVQVYSFDSGAFPESIGTDPVLARTGEVMNWDPQNMFEHVNGEAELFIRYGALSLAFVSYENDSGDYFSVDLLDVGNPLNAYGLYRLYSGCDGDELQVFEATVLADEFVPHANLGRYFIRINIDTGDNAHNGSALVADFLKHLSNNIAEQPALPPALEILGSRARERCEVNYHPEHIDYDLEAGPGYSWIGPDGNAYFLVVLDSQDQAKLRAQALKDKGVANLVLYKNAIIWGKAGDDWSAGYVEDIVKEIVDR